MIQGRKENEFEISESKVPGLSDKKIGSRFRGILNYKAIEKTRSFTMLKINFLTLFQTKRAF